MVIYYVVGIVVLVIAAVAIGVGYSMVKRLLNYLESKREVKVTKKDLGLNVRLHRPDHMKKLMKDYRVDDFRRVKKLEFES